MLPINSIIQGDSLEVLKTFSDNSVDSIITSPPYYGLRDYGVDGQIGLEKSLAEYIDKMLTITAELKRVLKPTGTMWWNHGDSYSTGDKESFVKATDDENMYSTKQTGRYKGGGITGVPQKSLIMQNHRLAIRMVDEQRWILRNQIIWHKPNVMPSSVKDRFTVDFEPVFFFSKSKKYWFEPQYESIAESSLKDKRRGKINYEGKWSNKNGYQTIAKRKSFTYIEIGGRNKRAVWKIATKPFKEAHFATFPETLIEPMIKAGCPEMICKKCGKAREPIFKTMGKQHSIGATAGNYYNERNFKGDNTVLNFSQKIGYTDCGCDAEWRPGIILDPFMGAGTTAVVAKKLGRNYIGIELNPEYIKIAEKRIKEIPIKLL